MLRPLKLTDLNLTGVNRLFEDVYYHLEQLVSEDGANPYSVNSLNSSKGAVNLLGGNGVDVETSGTNITIAAAGSFSRWVDKNIYIHPAGEKDLFLRKGSSLKFYNGLLGTLKIHLNGTTGEAIVGHLETSETTALTSTVQNVAKISHYTSGTPANGIGVGIEFEQETSADNNEVVAMIEAVTTDVTPTSESADLVLKNMSAGAAAAECARFSQTGFSVFGVAKQAKQAHIVDADGTLADITTKFNTLLADLEGYGFLETS